MTTVARNSLVCGSEAAATCGPVWKKREEATVSIMKIKDKIAIKRQRGKGGGAGGEGG